ncbi:glycoside hydrolase family 13 protein [Aquabacterium humicola]|uniref:glycoside hydrolase family 13 protein n=1 Tax=Aquabacterium humicola TaxID=3237377 RepID=UPI00254275F7|nr:glycoside hydrolase family 13 protein [Rubrivivax pictus]
MKRHTAGAPVVALAAALALASPLARAADDCRPDPLNGETLFLRGTMNNWAAQDDWAFQYRCNAWLLNVKLQGRHDFKIADESWTDARTWIVPSPEFAGEHTLRFELADGQPRLTLGPKSFDDPAARPMTDPVAASLRHDTRAAVHKAPFGAVRAGSRMRFAVDAKRGVERLTLVIEQRRMHGNQEGLAYVDAQRIPMRRTRAGADAERWSAAYRFESIGIWGYHFEAEVGGRVYVLHNNADAIFWTREKGSGGLGHVAELPADARRIRRFRQTVHAPDFRVPHWAADAVYYYIFPDRFRNGDRSNDPRPGRDRYHDQGVEFHASWLDKPFKPGSGDGSDAVHNNDFFGGDIAGIVDKLDHLRALGVNALYITPLFAAASNHKYDTADYHQIDAAFGSNEDFVRLTREAARRGIRVVPDMSLNHTGSDSIYFDRFGRHPGTGAFEAGRIRADSPYASWYRFDPTQTEIDKQYRGWVGVRDLPELDKASPDFRRFAYGAPDSVTRTWLQRGAAGWRMDVAPWVPDDFWREWRRVVKAQDPQAITIAETWFDASKHLVGDMFDSTMNYVFRNTVLEFANGGDAAALYRNLEWLREAYPKPALHALMNLLSSHDQARALHHLGHHGESSDAATIATAKQKLLLATLFQMSYPGAPAIYYGDEVGVTGGDDPYNRATYPWTDEGGRPDEVLRAEVQRLVQMRARHPVLRQGELLAPLMADAEVLVLARRLDRGTRSTWAITALNNAAVPRRMRIPLPPGSPSAYADALEGGSSRARARVLEITIPPRFGRVLISR